MKEFIKEIIKFECLICNQEHYSLEDIEHHLKVMKGAFGESHKEEIPENFKIGSVIPVKHRHEKTFSLAKIVAFGIDDYHFLKIYTDRYSRNRDSDCFPMDETVDQCSLCEVLTRDELEEYTHDQVEKTSNLPKLSIEEMVLA